MFISKKKWEDLNNQVDNLSRLVSALVAAHDEDYRYDCWMEKVKTFSHKSVVNSMTKTCGNVSLEELAQFVIDRKPIERTVVTKTTLNPSPCGDTCTAKIDDTIGAISYESKS